jgi:moderate conductance mechanosensitive channel
MKVCRLINKTIMCGVIMKMNIFSTNLKSKIGQRLLSTFIVVLACFATVSFLSAAPVGQAGGLPQEILDWDTQFQELEDRILTLEEYKPENFPDFKDLEIANQLMEQLDFSNRKADLLVKQYNIYEDELFPFLKDYVAKQPESIPALATKFRDYIGTKTADGGEKTTSIYILQKKLNRVFLNIERLEKKLERLQLAAKNKELEKENLEKSKAATQSESISAAISHLEEELGLFDRELAEESVKLVKLKEKDAQKSAKIEEIRTEAKDYKAKAPKAANRIERLIFSVFAKVREIRLNGLEIPRLNGIKTFIYLSETAIKTFEEKISDNKADIVSLQKLRKQEIINKFIKGSVIILIALFMVFLILKVSRRISKKIVDRIEESDSIDSHRKQRYHTLSAVIITFIKVTIWIMAVLWVLGELEIDYAPFLVAAGGLSLAIGFGAQSLVKDIVSGFFILMEEQFALGDGVDINGIGGSVEKISLRTVKIRSLDGTLHTIPTGSITKVSNKTYQWSRAVVKVGASYNDDSDKVLEVLNKVAKEMYKESEWKDSFLEEPSAQGILSFGDSAVDYRVLSKTPAGKQWALSREMMIRIKKAFEEAGIDIPYNYMNVNLIDHTKAGQE